MNSLVVISLAVVALACGAPQEPRDQAPVYIVSQDAYVHPEGYTFQFETSDGTSRREQGSLRPAAADGGAGALAVSGAYRYVSPDGAVHSVAYVADEHGFQPTDHVVEQ